VSSWFGIDVPGIVGAGLDGLAVDATLHVVTQGSRTPGDLGGGLNPTEADVGCRGYETDYEDSEIDGRKILRTDRRVVIFASSLGATIPKKDDKVTIGGTEYRIHAVNRDPAGATYHLQARG
jgi:hypothetical protein